MAVLEWDKSEEKIYQTGIDRGVLYLTDGTYAAWNGLTGLDDGNNSELKSYYLDGVKFLETVTPGDFVGKLRAFTYPDEFDQVIGISEFEAPGLFFHEQPMKKFNLTYRTKIGSADNPDAGYKLNLLYNLSVVPDASAFGTLQESISLTEFAWSLTGVPVKVDGRRPTCHISIDSRETDPAVLVAVERVLYGTPTTPPRMPSIVEVQAIFMGANALIIIDNGDGTWTAHETIDGSYISMVDSTTFEISDVDATYVDPYLYEIYDTYAHTETDQPVSHLLLESEDGNTWEVLITVDGTLDVTAHAADPYSRHSYKLVSPDTTVWELTATNDGTLNLEESTSSITQLDRVRFISSADAVWILTATDDGYLDVTLES